MIINPVNYKLGVKSLFTPNNIYKQTCSESPAKTDFNIIKTNEIFIIKREMVK